MQRINKLATLLLSIVSLSGCSLSGNNEFTWGTSKCGPKGYPLDILSGTMYFKGEETGLGLATGTVMGTWGNTFAKTSLVHKKLPDRFEITFYSYAENQSYRGEFDLPYDKLLALFQWGAENAVQVGDEKRPIFNDLVVGVAPGGTVAVWVYGNQEQREVFVGQAKKIDLVLDYVFQVPFRSDEEAEQFRVEVLEGNIGPVRFKELAKNGIPFDIWQRYRQPYSWVMEGAAFRHFNVSNVNGYSTRQPTNYTDVQLLPVPSHASFVVGRTVYDFRFDDYETIMAFEELAAIEGLTEAEQVVHIEITPRVDQVTSTVRLYNAKHSIDLKKTVFKP